MTTILVRVYLDRRHIYRDSHDDSNQTQTFVQHSVSLLEHTHQDRQQKRHILICVRPFKLKLC